MIRVDAWQKYNASLMVWATLAPHQQKPKRAPKVPSILKEDSDG